MGKRKISKGDAQRGLIAIIAVLLATAIVVGLVILGNSLASHDDSAGPSSSVSNTSKTNAGSFGTMPKDAGKSAMDWYMSLIGKLNDSGLPADFFNDDKSTDILNEFAQGKYGKLPKEVQDSVVFTEDAQQNDGRLVDYNTLKAAALTSVIMGWQFNRTAVNNDSSFKPSQNGVMVDRTHGQVVFPMESVCGIPVSYTIVIDWTGSEWKLDGDVMGSQVASQVRANQLQDKYDKVDKQSSGTTK